jgi:hypothetical protein
MKSMAVSKIQNGFQMIYESDYTKFFTPESGVTANLITIRQVEKNIYYLFFRVNATIPANGRIKVGELNLAFFGDKPIVAYIPGEFEANGKHYPVIVNIGANGEIFVNNESSTAISGQAITAMGNITRREI